MAREVEEHPRPILIGPEPDELLRLQPREDAAGDPPQLEGRKLIVRLVVAFFVIVVVAAACFVLLPLVGIPPWVPLAAFVVIAIAVLTNAGAEGKLPGAEEGEAGEDRGCGDGRPVGCCPGPRPPRFLSDRPRRG